MVDRSAIKINQFFVILFSISAFLFNEWIIAFILGLIMVIGAFWPKFSPFLIFYQKMLKPARWIKPEIINEDSNPHQFASVMGGSMVIVSSLFLSSLYLPIISWGLILLVAFLALTNLALGFCAGCFIYFQFSKFKNALNSRGDA